MNPTRLAERLARESYGRLLALLAARTRDIAAAEDALSDAFAAALAVWPRTGSPDRPEAWLFSAAKRKLIDAARRAKVARDSATQVAFIVEELEAEVAESKVPDRRLGLMFACTHDCVDEPVRTPLMLQVVLGLSAERIAAAFLMAPPAMSQRLVRAKNRIADAGASFETPPLSEWATRLGPVTQAIYAAYSEGWSDIIGGDTQREKLTDEAIWLARVLVDQAPTEPEALGLLALMLHLEARRSARRVDGCFIPTDMQDISSWCAEMQTEAEQLLYRAARENRPGRFQLEAAIQSAHAARRVRGDVDWVAIVLLYDGLVQFHPSAVTRLNRAAAIAQRDGARAGLAELDVIDARVLKSYQPFWALRADLLRQLGRSEEARVAYDEAIARERDPAVIQFLTSRRALL